MSASSEPSDVSEHEDPRLNEVEGDEGMPGELIGGDHNLPGSQKPPPGAKSTSTAISDSKGTSSHSD